MTDRQRPGAPSDTVSAGGPTRALATFVANLKPEDIPTPALDQARLLTFDLFGTAVFVAHRTPWGRIVAEVAGSELQGAPAAGVIGTRTRTAPPAAALANGTLAMGFEYEDMHPTSGGHPYSIAFPAAFAVGQWLKRSGREVLTAAIAGYEVETRVGLGQAPERSTWVERGLYPITMLGVFGAAGAAARAMRLSAEQTAHALGIAGSHAFGTMQAHAEGTMARRLHGGKAAEVGVTAAILAARGFTGPVQILEGEFGFFRTYARDYDLPAITAALGQSLMIEDAWLKYYPVNGLFQAPIDALRALRTAYNFGARDVVSINATIAHASRMHATRVYTSTVRAQFSLPVCLAITLLDDRPRPDRLLQPITDPAIIALADRINVTLDAGTPPGHPDATRFGRVEVTLADGRTLRREVLYPKGHPRNPMSWENVHEKFTELLEGWVNPARRRELAQSLAGFDRHPDVSSLDICVSPSP